MEVLRAILLASTKISLLTHKYVNVLSIGISYQLLIFFLKKGGLNNSYLQITTKPFLTQVRL